MKRIALGTANLFQNYKGNTAKDPEGIIKRAEQIGIEYIDYASDYGGTVDKFLGRFKVNNKVSTTTEASPYCFNSIHYYKDIKIYDWLKSQYGKIGMSAYYPHELYDKEFHLVEVPFSVQDQRFSYVVNRYPETWARSIFMRGRVFSDPLYKTLSETIEVPIEALCINYPLVCGFKRVVIGVDNIEQLEKSVEQLKYYDKVMQYKNELMLYGSNDPEIYDPMRWKQ